MDGPGVYYAKWNKLNEITRNNKCKGKNCMPSVIAFNVCQHGREKKPYV